MKELENDLEMREKMYGVVKKLGVQIGNSNIRI
jgi:hypothetical protein